MIWAALAAAIAIAIAASQAGPDHWKELIHTFRKAIKANVKDKDRREKALAILEAADADMIKTRQGLVGHFNEAYEVHRRHESTLADYETAVAALMDDVHAVEVAGMERRFELKEALTLDEYNAIFADVQEEVIKGDKKDAKKDAKQKKKDERKAAKGK